MARREQFTVGELLQIGVSNGAVTVLERDASNNILKCTGTSVPSGSEGYAKGCIFIKTDAGDGVKSVYENVGTTSSCSFDLIGQVDDDAVTYAKLEESTLQYATVSLSNSDIKNLRATPKELVAAPGANKVIEFVSALLLLNAGSEVLTESDDNMAIRYTDGSGAIVSETIESTNFIDQAADTLTNAIAKADAIVAKTGAVNQALVLHNTGDGEFAGNASNDATMTVKVVYRVHDFS